MAELLLVKAENNCYTIYQYQYQEYIENNLENKLLILDPVKGVIPFIVYMFLFIWD